MWCCIRGFSGCNMRWMQSPAWAVMRNMLQIHLPKDCLELPSWWIAVGLLDWCAIRNHRSQVRPTSSSSQNPHLQVTRASTGPSTRSPGATLQHVEITQEDVGPSSRYFTPTSHLKPARVLAWLHRPQAASIGPAQAPQSPKAPERWRGGEVERWAGVPLRCSPPGLPPGTAPPPKPAAP